MDNLEPNACLATAASITRAQVAAAVQATFSTIPLGTKHLSRFADKEHCLRRVPRR